MKILYVTTVGATMGFFTRLVEELIADGHTVDIATNDSVRKVPDCYARLGCRVFSLTCSRSPWNKGNLDSIGMIKRLVKEERYDIVHCHTPIAAACARLACRKLRKSLNVKVFYTAHGFHFYKGAPKLNWMVYYPIEKICSRFTDKLITINKEDYELAKAKFKAKEIHYVPGVGIDLSRFKNIQVDRSAKRKEIGVPDDAFLLLSVGELNTNKNHQLVIRALAELGAPDVHYAIAGVGAKRDFLLALAEELGVSHQVHLLGYRNDIAELNHSADAFCFPSIREGLPVAPLEAMACGRPVVAAKNRGTVEFVVHGKNGFLCGNRDASGMASSIAKLMNEETLIKELSEQACSSVDRFRVESIIGIMKELYEQGVMS